MGSQLHTVPTGRVTRRNSKLYFLVYTLAAKGCSLHIKFNSIIKKISGMQFIGKCIKDFLSYLCALLKHVIMALSTRHILIQHCAPSTLLSFKALSREKLGYKLAKCVAALDKKRDIWSSLREYKYDNS